MSQHELIVDEPSIEGCEGLLAIITRHGSNTNSPYGYPPGVKFITPHELPLQVATITHSKDHVIPPHVHLVRKTEVNRTLEVIIVMKGLLKVNFYSSGGRYNCCRILGKGDVVVLIAGGHGFEVLESVELVEVKQGPYGGMEFDKMRF